MTLFSGLRKGTYVEAYYRPEVAITEGRDLEAGRKSEDTEEGVVVGVAAGEAEIEFLSKGLQRIPLDWIQATLQEPKLPNSTSPLTTSSGAPETVMVAAPDAAADVVVLSTALPTTTTETTVVTSRRTTPTQTTTTVTATTTSQQPTSTTILMNSSSTTTRTTATSTVTTTRTTTTTRGPFVALTAGSSCLGSGAFPIPNLTLCEEAARYLGLATAGPAKIAHHDTGQDGCFYQEGQVWLAARVPRLRARAAAGRSANGSFVDWLWGRSHNSSQVAFSEWLHKSKRRLAGRSLETPTSQALCASRSENAGPLEVDTDYVGSDLRVITGITSALACNDLCLGVKACVSWTWQSTGGGLSRHDCFLKYASPRKKARLFGLVSGTPVRETLPSSMLYCFAVVIPWGFEPKLVRLQYDEGSSIFDCDAHTVYSSRAMTIAPGVKISIVHEDLRCKFGGEFYTCLNTGIFKAIWTRVLNDGVYLFHNWTVKVDPDSVFLPERLRRILRGYGDGARGAYLNNCKYGLHGPLEVFSREAVQAYGAVGHLCYSGPHELNHVTWGEDLFMDMCLWKVLNVTRINNYQLINEEHCDSNNWRECKGGSVVFHPFKEPSDYRQCLAKASLEQLPG